MVSMLNIKYLRIGIVRTIVQTWNRRDALGDPKTSSGSRVSAGFRSIYRGLRKGLQPSGCAEQRMTGSKPDHIRLVTA